MFQNALEDFQHTVAERPTTEWKQSRDMRSQEQILTELKALRIRAFEILQAPGICEQKQGSVGDAGRTHLAGDSRRFLPAFWSCHLDTFRRVRFKGMVRRRRNISLPHRVGCDCDLPNAVDARGPEAGEFWCAPSSWWAIAQHAT
jgi:hypothetical protein